MTAVGLLVAGILVYVADDCWPTHFAESIPTADEVYVSKSKRELFLLNDGVTIKSYRISLGGPPSGRKTEEDDEKTPEGIYTIDWRNENSRYYRSPHVSYPNAADESQAAVRNVAPGGDIVILGAPNGLGLFSWVLGQFDWADGCIAVSNSEMAEIWAQYQTALR